MQSTWEVKQPFGTFFKFLVTLFILVIIPLSALTIWVNNALSAPSKEESTKSFVIKEGESPASFCERLQKEGIIKNAFVFRVYLKLSGFDRKIQAGSFSLVTNKKAADIAKDLTEGRVDKWVTLVEGLRKEQIAEILNRDFEIDKEIFLTSAEEGYLFPDKYLIPVKTDEKRILSIFKENFEKKFTKEMEEKAASQKLNMKEILIIASLVERESMGKGENEREIIAGIILKRWKEEWRIAADATVQYALGYSEEEKTWWRKVITEEDLKIRSPYNTRIYVGLPPGPICSPGLASIQAVISPKETDYYFYIHDKNGNPYYAETFAQHQENIRKYLSD